MRCVLLCFHILRALCFSPTLSEAKYSELRSVHTHKTNRDFRVCGSIALRAWFCSLVDHSLCFPFGSIVGPLSYWLRGGRENE